MWTLPYILNDRARSNPDRAFVLCPEDDQIATFGECAETSIRIASGLLDRGGLPGDRLLIMAPNSLAFIQVWFACSYAGLVELPINTSYFGHIFEHQVGLAAPSFAVVAPEFAATLINSEAAKRSIRRVFVAPGSGNKSEAIAAFNRAGFFAEDFEALVDSKQRRLPVSVTSAPGAMLFTSGTSGPSKAVINPHGQIHLFGELVASLTRLNETDVILSVGPLFHANAQFLSVYAALVSSARVVVRRKFSASSWRDWIRTDGATVANLVGEMMTFIVRQDREPYEQENQLRCVLTAPTPWNVVDEFRERFGVACVTEDYGSTEVCLPILCPYGEARPKGACGLLLDDWYDARIVDHNDDEVAEGEPGELVLRPRVPWTTSLGYFGMPEKTLATQRNLWIHTGDTLRRDSEGWFYFVDRTNDALRRKGENISSHEVEAPMLEHPDVAECAVVGVNSESGTEHEVMAVIVAREGASLTAADLWLWCDERIPAFARPRFLRFVSALPKTPSQKIEKVKLRALGVAGASDRLKDLDH